MHRPPLDHTSPSAQTRAATAYAGSILFEIESLAKVKSQYIYARITTVHTMLRNLQAFVDHRTATGKTSPAVQTIASALATLRIRLADIQQTPEWYAADAGRYAGEWNYDMEAFRTDFLNDVAGHVGRDEHSLQRLARIYAYAYDQARTAAATTTTI